MNGGRVVAIWIHRVMAMSCSFCGHLGRLRYTVVVNYNDPWQSLCEQCVNRHLFSPDIWSEETAETEYDSVTMIAIDRAFAEHVGLMCTRTAKI